jgi:hypothetical protein
MLIRSRPARIIAAPVTALSAVIAAFLLLYRLPMWLIGLSGPWEYRSTSNHLVSDAIGIGLIVLGLVALPALTRILYLAWSPAPSVVTPSTAHSVDGWLPNTSLERTRER